MFNYFPLQCSSSVPSYLLGETREKGPASQLFREKDWCAIAIAVHILKGGG